MFFSFFFFSFSPLPLQFLFPVKKNWKGGEVGEEDGKGGGERKGIFRFFFLKSLFDHFISTFLRSYKPRENQKITHTHILHTDTHTHTMATTILFNCMLTVAMMMSVMMMMTTAVLGAPTSSQPKSASAMPVSVHVSSIINRYHSHTPRCGDHTCHSIFPWKDGVQQQQADAMVDFCTNTPWYQKCTNQPARCPPSTFAQNILIQKGYDCNFCCCDGASDSCCTHTSESPAMIAVYVVIAIIIFWRCVVSLNNERR